MLSFCSLPCYFLLLYPFSCILVFALTLFWRFPIFLVLFVSGWVVHTCIFMCVNLSLFLAVCVFLVSLYIYSVGLGDIWGGAKQTTRTLLQSPAPFPLWLVNLSSFSLVLGCSFSLPLSDFPLTHSIVCSLALSLPSPRNSSLLYFFISLGLCFRFVFLLLLCEYLSSRDSPVFWVHLLLSFLYFS